MADDMSNGSFDPQARYAALDERVTNLRSSFVNLEGEMRSGFASINNHLTSVSNELRLAGKTQWPVIWMAAGVVFTVLAGLGAVLYSPIKADVVKLQDTTVSRSEWTDNQTRSSENRLRLENLITKLAESVVGRNEMDQMVTEYRDYKTRIDTELSTKLDRVTWEERNHARDVEIADLQRRIEETRQEVGSVYGTRDVIQDLKRQLESLQQKVLDPRSTRQAFPD